MDVLVILFVLLLLGNILGVFYNYKTEKYVLAIFSSFVAGLLLEYIALLVVD